MHQVRQSRNSRCTLGAKETYYNRGKRDLLIGVKETYYVTPETIIVVKETS
jgi:hypothetical protein